MPLLCNDSNLILRRMSSTLVSVFSWQCATLTVVVSLVAVGIVTAFENALEHVVLSFAEFIRCVAINNCLVMKTNDFSAANAANIAAIACLSCLRCLFCVLNQLLRRSITTVIMCGPLLRRDII